MSQLKRIEDHADLKVRVSGAVKAELDDLALRHEQSLSGVVRLALRAGLPALRALPPPGLTDPYEVRHA